MRAIFDRSTDSGTRPIAVRFPESEIDRLVKLARAYGEPSVSSYLRKLAQANIHAHSLE